MTLAEYKHILEVAENNAKFGSVAAAYGFARQLANEIEAEKPKTGRGRPKKTDVRKLAEDLANE